MSQLLNQFCSSGFCDTIALITYSAILTTGVGILLKHKFERIKTRYELGYKGKFKTYELLLGVLYPLYNKTFLGVGISFHPSDLSITEAVDYIEKQWGIKLSQVSINGLSENNIKQKMEHYHAEHIYQDLKKDYNRLYLSIMTNRLYLSKTIEKDLISLLVPIKEILHLTYETLVNTPNLGKKIKKRSKLIKDTKPKMDKIIHRIVEESRKYIN